LPSSDRLRPNTLPGVRYRLVIFDLDGTLSDSFPWFLTVVNSFADKHGFRRIEDHEVETLRGKSSREIIRSLNVPYWKLPAIGADMRRLKAQHMSEIPLFDGVPEMLRDLVAKGVTLAIVSSDNEANARAALGSDASLIRHYDCGASLFGKASKYKHVMKAAGMSARETLSVGDEVRDAEAARGAGIDFAAVAWGYARPDALRAQQPVTVFGRVAAIPEFVVQSA
jgi:phosphoglycolate phosphatase